MAISSPRRWISSISQRTRVLPWHREELHSMTTHADGRWHTPQLIPRRLLRSGQVHHPAVLEEARRRSQNLQLRLADRITAFAGSMNFVWIHAALFGVWMLLLEPSP